jgi:hypothetical protein
MSILKSHSTHEEKIHGPFGEAKVRLEQIEADAKRKGIEIAALTGLAVTKRNIDRKLEDLKKAHESNRSHSARVNRLTQVFGLIRGLGRSCKREMARGSRLQFRQTGYEMEIRLAF